MAAPLTDGLSQLAGVVQAAQEVGSGAVANVVQAQLLARPNRSFNRRCHGRLPCPRGSACISSATRARQPAASPGYLYVRPRRRQCSGSRSLQLASGALANRGRPRAARPALVVAQRSVGLRRFAPGKASVLRRCAQGSVVAVASRQRAAPRSQYAGAPRTYGLARLAVVVHAARKSDSVSVADVGSNAVVGAA